MQYGSRLEDHTCAACYKPLSIPAHYQNGQAHIGFQGRGSEDGVH
jgi:hypothetical protein